MTVHATIDTLRRHLEQRIIGQPELLDGLLIALLADGHLLVEGAPGLAKTTAVKELAACLEGDFHRIQFTPDLLPADLTGTEVFRPADGSFHFERGPLFHNLLLADEINRAPAKVQSALLEAMAERQITVGRSSYTLPELFLVMATQNPIEHEGTYPLPFAQLDRFLMKVVISYPDRQHERDILRLAREAARRGPGHDASDSGAPVIPQQTIFDARSEILQLHLSPDLEDYLVQLVTATRDGGTGLRVGASPRASIALERCARAHAWLAGRDYVGPEDIQAMAPAVLRHRILLSYEMEADGVSADELIGRILNTVAVP
jgi:MoxR-like ATPase